ncbi:MAG TPA: hypothetical protein VGO37_21475 [Steroidobacteraceae bacterium]|nr:hypothetical protein [Steroidobacteraceae bacterium]
MLAHPEDSLLADGRALSDLMQGVTLEVMGEFSMGPLNQKMKERMVEREGDIKYPVTWTTLAEYLETLERRGISPNVGSFVGASTIRTFVLGEADVQPIASQITDMRALVHRAMEDGALGVTTMLIYAPATYAKTPELIALAQESARCGGIYTVHMRSEGDRIESALQETIDIAAASGGPAEIYHLKVAGKDNWGKLDRVVASIEKARASGIRISADMYDYTAGATGLDAAMPPWVQDGGLEAWIQHLKDPAVRARVIAEMRDPHPGSWENLYGAAGAEGTLLLAFKNPKLKPLTGKSLAEVAKERGVSPEDAAVDLVIEDGSRVGIAYFLMNENNIRRQVALPWVSFGSDESGDAPEGVFLLSGAHPRAYGNFARVLAEICAQGTCFEPRGGGTQAHRPARGQSIAARSRPAQSRGFRRHRGLRSEHDPRPRHLPKTASVKYRGELRHRERQDGRKGRTAHRGRDRSSGAWASVDRGGERRLPRRRERLVLVPVKSVRTSRARPSRRRATPGQPTMTSLI